MIAAGLGTPRQRSALVFVLLVLVCALAAWLLAPLLVPLIIAVAFYALLEPFVGYLGRLGFGHGGAVLSALLVVLLGVIAVVALVAPQMFDQLAHLQQRLPGVIDILSERFAAINAWMRERTALPLGDSRFVASLSSYSGDWGKDVLLGLSSRFVQLTAVLILVPLFTYFLLADYRSLRNRLMSLVSNAQFELAWLIYYRVARQLQRYIRGVLLQSLVMAVISACGFALAGLDLWILLGVLTGLLNLIPYVGPLMAMVLAAFVVLAQAGMDPALLAAAVGVVLLAQVIDNVLVIPAVIAEAADLHPLGVIIGVIIFGNLFGFVGMVLAVPTLAAGSIVFVELRRGLGPGDPGPGDGVLAAAP